MVKYGAIQMEHTGRFGLVASGIPVPDSGLSDGFALAYSWGQRWFSTFDINGDLLPDLVQTASPEREGGYAFRDQGGFYWKVWLGTPMGFSATSARWSVPDSGLDDGFFNPFWSTGVRWFATIDLSGDGIPELIQTADSGQDGGLVWRDDSGPYWKVWLGGLDGFAHNSIRWSVPESGLSDGFFPMVVHGQSIFQVWT